MNLSPHYYNLTARTQLKELSTAHIAIVKRIKSRIIQKDAWKIVEAAEKIKAIEPTFKVGLVCNDNICSKSLKVLEENDIEVHIAHCSS